MASVECVVTFTNGRTFERTVEMSGQGKEALEALSTVLSSLRDEVNVAITEVVEQERTAGKTQKRSSSQVDSSSGENNDLLFHSVSKPPPQLQMRKMMTPHQMLNTRNPDRPAVCLY